jgi:hypothetical protein
MGQPGTDRLPIFQGRKVVVLEGRDVHGKDEENTALTRIVTSTDRKPIYP